MVWRAGGTGALGARPQAPRVPGAIKGGPPGNWKPTTTPCFDLFFPHLAAEGLCCLQFVRRLVSYASPSSRKAGPWMAAAAASFKGRAIAGSFVSRVLAGKAASPRYMPREAADLFSFVYSHHIGVRVYF